MVGLVIAAHGHLAEEMVSTAEQIVGKLSNVATCSVEPGASPESIKAQLRAAIGSVEQGEGALVLADLFGGTPCTLCLSLAQEAPIEVVTGVNLPMLLKASSLRTSGLDLAELARQLTEYGQRNITNASSLLREGGLRPHHH